jgi:hypothetical protein
MVVCCQFIGAWYKQVAKNHGRALIVPFGRITSSRACARELLNDELAKAKKSNSSWCRACCGDGSWWSREEWLKNLQLKQLIPRELPVLAKG